MAETEHLGSVMERQVRLQKAKKRNVLASK